MKNHSINAHPVFTTAALGLTWIFIAFYIGTPLPLEQLNFTDILSEGAICLMAFFLLYVSVTLRVRRDTHLKLLIGFALLFLGMLQDLLDEMITIDHFAPLLFEKVGIPSGMLFIGLGLYEVGHAYQATQVLLGRHRDIERRLSNIDQLTKLFNRRYFFSQGPEFIDSAASTDSTLAALLFSIRDQERINHEYSFQAGDEVLIKFAEILRNNSRTRDLAARLSGRQFAMLLADNGPAIGVDKLRRQTARPAS